MMTVKTHPGLCMKYSRCNVCYSYTIAVSGLFELYARGGCLNHEAKPSGLNTHLERTIQ